MVFNLVQALQETRALTEDHADDPAWMALRERVDTLLAKLTDEARDPTTSHPRARQRRPPMHREEAELAAAALMAVHDRPERYQLDLALAAVDDLADAIE